MRRLTFILLSCLLAVRVTAAALAPAADCPTGACPLAPPQAENNIAVDSRPIARIENTTAAGSSYGSGTLVDTDRLSGLVVTCAHLFRDGTGTITVMFPESSRHTARLIKIDHDADLAAVSISAPAMAPIELAQNFPQQGDPLVSCGYGSDGRLWCNRGQALGYVTMLGGHGRETLELSGSARQGDSGGPVLDSHGHLVAVLFGTNGRVVDATFCGRVRQFLQGLSPRFGGKAADNAAPAEGTQHPPLENLPPHPPPKPSSAEYPITRQRITGSRSLGRRRRCHQQSRPTLALRKSRRAADLGRRAGRNRGHCRRRDRVAGHAPRQKETASPTRSLEEPHGGGERS